MKKKLVCSGKSPKGSEMVWGEAQKSSGRNGLGGAQKSSEMVWEKPKKAQAQKSSAGTSPMVWAPAKCLGLRVFTFDTQRLDRLDGQCGPCLALERAPALRGLHDQCSQVAALSRTLGFRV